MRKRILDFHPGFLILALFFKESASHFAFSDGRQVFLNPILLSWDEAVSACHDMNGTLLTVFDMGTLVDLGIDGKWIAWVGLKVLPEDNLDSSRWVSGDSLFWINWFNPISFPSGRESCTTVTTTHPYRWTANNCTTKWPSLCEVRNGTSCRFEVTRRSSLVAFNNAQVFDVTLDTCRETCETSRKFNCLSFEYNSLRKYCQLSDTHRWMHQGNFAVFDKEWDYYHRNCYTVHINDTWVPNGEMVTTTQVSSSTPLSTFSSTITEDPVRPGYICVKEESLQQTENKTEEMKKEVQELKAIGEVYKEKRRSQSKQSASDNRPSARYMGTIALAIAVGLLLAVISLDLLTITQHCSKCKGKGKDKGKSKIEVRSRNFKDFAAGRVIPPSWPSVDSNSAAHHHYSSPTDLEDVEIRVQEADNAVVEPDIHAHSLPVGASLANEMAINSYVSWPYSKTSPVLFPFYRSKSEKTKCCRKSPSASTQRQSRSKSDSFFNKRIHVLPESHKDWLSGDREVTKTEQLVMAYGHHFEGQETGPKKLHSMEIGKLRRGSHC